MDNITPNLLNTAEDEATHTLADVINALSAKQNFKLEAGAGAGKTYSLIEALRHILKYRQEFLPRDNQRVACLTYTRVARDEINSRTNGDRSIFAETLHGFLWEMISPYRKAIVTEIAKFETWKQVLRDDIIEDFDVEYQVGIRNVNKERKLVSLHHDDIPKLAIEFFKNQKFRALVCDRFPVIFIDEYQDTPAGLAETILAGYETDKRRPVIGLFGDHWQQIYENTCGSTDDPNLIQIAKRANFRSDKSVVNLLNSMRPELPQAPHADADEGTVTIYHTNNWPGTRLSRHWKDQISFKAVGKTLALIRNLPQYSSWNKNCDELRILMLTHATIAKEIGYPGLHSNFQYNESFTKAEDPIIGYLVNTVEPALSAFKAHRYGELLEILGSGNIFIYSPIDKQKWTNFFDQLSQICELGTVEEVLILLGEQKLFSIPSKIAKLEKELSASIAELTAGTTSQLSRRMSEYQGLKTIEYSEIRKLTDFLNNHTPFATQHSVKGAEFNNVIVLVGKGWANYDFGKMLSTFKSPASRNGTFTRSRNLFYVAASRAKHNLILLFVQELDDDALDTLKSWAGEDNIIALDFDDDITPRLPIP